MTRLPDSVLSGARLGKVEILRRFMGLKIERSCYFARIPPPYTMPLCVRG
jgi:hypothetical protein